MAFRMTSDIIVDKFKPFKGTSFEWTRSIQNICDSAKFTLPALCRLKGNNYNSGTEIDFQNSRDNVATGLVFKEGQKVSFYAGYDYKNKLRFQGFISRINFTSPLVVECEGYSYQLRNKIINKKYVNTTLKTILNELVEGTDIKVSEDVPDVQITYLRFPQYTGLQVLEDIKTKCLQTVYFKFNVLYVGLKYLGNRSGEVKHRLNWNVIRDNELLYNQRKSAITNIVLEQRSETGHIKRVKVLKPGNEKVLKLFGIDVNSEYAKKIREDLEKQHEQRSYDGKITGFLEPICDLNMTSVIIDDKYKEREGKFVIVSIEGSFGPQGGRQKIGIGAKVG